MKKLISLGAKKVFNSVLLTVAALVLSFYSFAQDKKIDVTIGTKPDNGNSFFMQPWVWIVGGAVFILLLIALLRGSGSKK